MAATRQSVSARRAFAAAIAISLAVVVRGMLDHPQPASAQQPSTVPAATTTPSATAAPTTTEPEPTTAPEPATTTTAATVATTTTAPVPSCRAAVLVHGGAYVVGDHTMMEASYAAPMRAAGWRVWNVDYPLADPALPYDPASVWYPRKDLGVPPVAMREVHDRAVAAVAPVVDQALATGCAVTLVGESAGGSIVADLAHLFPTVHEGVLVSGATITPDHIGGAPLTIYYGGLDRTVTADASVATCERWVAAGSVCQAHGLWGAGHADAAVEHASLLHLLAAS